MDQKLVKIEQFCDEEDLYEESNTPLRWQSTSEEHPPTHLGVTVANDESSAEPTTVRQTLSGSDAELWNDEMKQEMNSRKFGRSLIYLLDERRLEANGWFSLNGIRVILPLNSSISIGAIRYTKLCSKIEKFIKNVAGSLWTGSFDWEWFEKCRKYRWDHCFLEW